MSSAHRNQDRNFEVVTTTGQFVCAEKCRNSLGSFAKMMDRLAGRFGSTLRSQDGGETWSAGGLNVRLVEVQAL